MKNIPSKLFVALSGIMALGVSVPAIAQQATANGTIKIVRPLTVTRDVHMAFGTIIKPATGASAGSVAVPAAAGDGRTLTNVTAVGGGQAAAKFTLEGEGGQAVSVTVDPSFTMAGSVAGSLTVTTVKSVIPPNLSGDLGDIAAGTLVFYVGGSIPITAATPSGDYTGQFNVTASYN